MNDVLELFALIVVSYLAIFSLVTLAAVVATRWARKEAKKEPQTRNKAKFCLAIMLTILLWLVWLKTVCIGLLYLWLFLSGPI